jgi:tRNA (cmo5U34)-methyltransferase
MQVEAVKDQTMPNGKWEFDASVTDAFDDMLRRSIPQYDVMRDSVFRLACDFVEHRTAVVDLGCSRGEALAPFVDKYGIGIQAIGVEISEPMLEAARERFAGYIKAGCVEIRQMDLRREFPPVKASVVMSILTLQFTPIEYRLQILKRIYDSLIPGGAFILVEKLIGGSAKLDELMIKHYYALKADHGYSQDQIDRKRLSLEGVLVPMTARWNEEMLRLTGFSQVDCFWRWMNFAGWVAIKN